MIKIQKTDGRHTGHESFPYYAQVRRSNLVTGMTTSAFANNFRLQLLQEYNTLRNWCVETWGMTCDRTHYLELEQGEFKELNEHWCWHTEFNELKIYLKSQKDANWMRLRWECVM